MEKTKKYIGSEEQRKAARCLLAKLNSYTDKPMPVNYEDLKADETSLTLSTPNGAYKAASYITGGYKVEFPFEIIYRTQPVTNNDRLNGDETLDSFADWIMENPPTIGGNVTNEIIEISRRSNMIARYQDGTEDHSVSLTLTYEVI